MVSSLTPSFPFYGPRRPSIPSRPARLPSALFQFTKVYHPSLAHPTANYCSPPHSALLASKASAGPAGFAISCAPAVDSMVSLRSYAVRSIN
jgi:hypothetical protein